MGTGIQICGLNGCGKSTLGKALAERMGFYFIDNEHLYFSRTHADEPYMSPRSRAEVERLLMEEVVSHPDFVFAAVKGDYGKDVLPMYNYVVVMEVSLRIRAQRVRNRSFQKFGSRMLEGGDLHDQEEAFFQLAASRRDEDIERWLQQISCPVIRVDGTRPVEENVAYILRAIDGYRAAGW